MNILASDKSTLTWDFDSAEFALRDNAGRGRMQKTHLPCGLMLYRSEFQVEKKCVIDTSTTDEQLNQLLCTQMLLSGKVFMEVGGKAIYQNTPQRALLFRVVEAGTRIHLPGNQVVRHVGVSAPIESVSKHAGMGGSPGKLAIFLGQEWNAAVVREVKVRNRLRKMLADLFSSSYAGPMGQMGREGMAMTIYAELLNEYLKTQDTAPQPVTLWEEAAFEDVVAYLTDNLEKQLSIELLVSQFGLKKHRLEKLFLSQLNCPMGEFMRRQRMLTARKLIESKQLPPKSAATQVGYNHVSNFSRAYRQYFGETPGQTLKLSRRPR